MGPRQPLSGVLHILYRHTQRAENARHARPRGLKDRKHDIRAFLALHMGHGYLRPNAGRGPFMEGSFHRTTAVELTPRGGRMIGQRGEKGIGSHKHGISRHSPKSPRFKFMRELEANKETPKARPALTAETVSEAVDAAKIKRGWKR
jgi:hypothetical protein